MILDFKANVDIKKRFENHKYILQVYPEESSIEDQLGDQLTLFDINQNILHLNSKLT